MAFLKLNGITIPVMHPGGKFSLDYIGGTADAIDGTIHRDLRRTRRPWNMSCGWLNQLDAEALIGLLLGKGQHWATNGNIYSDSGLGPDSSTNIEYQKSTGDDGDPSTDYIPSLTTSGPSVLRGTNSLSMNPAATNSLPAVERDCDSAPATDFNLSGSGSLSTNSSNYYLGTASGFTNNQCLGILLTSSGYAYTSTVAHSSGSWTGSVYVKTVSAETIYVAVAASGGATGTTTTTLTPTPGEWTRVTATLTPGGGAGFVELRVGATTGLPVTIYCDAFQLENTAYSTNWVDGVRSASANNSFTISQLTAANDLTVMSWVKGTSNTAVSTIASMGTSNNSLSIFTSATNRYPSAQIFNGSTSVLVSDTSAGLTPYKWYHVAATFDSQLEQIELYVDGVSKGTGGPVGTLDYSLWGEGNLGVNQVGTNIASTEVDDLQLLPYALSSGAISDYYNSGTVQAVSLPRLVATGDFIRQSSINVICTDLSVDYRPCYDDANTAWANNGVMINFTLVEALEAQTS